MSQLLLGSGQGLCLAVVNECREFLSTADAWEGAGAGAADLEEARSQGFTLVDFCLY